MSGLFSRKKRGRPRKAGARYRSGGLKPEAPNPAVLARRRALAADPAMAENPLDAALANGWLTEAEHRAGRAYAALWRRSLQLAPRLAAAHLEERAATPDPERASLRLRDMTDAEIAAAWDAAFGPGARPADPAARDAQAAAALKRWRAVNAALTAAERAELFAVCVEERWPAWIGQRLEAEALRKAAHEERRALTEAEEAAVYRRFRGGGDERRRVLVAGLRAVGKGMGGRGAACAAVAPGGVTSAPASAVVLRPKTASSVTAPSTPSHVEH
ncbi:MAG: hypothetical protein JO127_09675 [Caulobacteraceae bacterium]|nr:hypothetical protein [Caulobacteraceae bacterium]